MSKEFQLICAGSASLGNNMYILVNKDNIIVASAVNKPSEHSCSKKGQKVFQLPDAEYSPEMIGSELVSYDSISISDASK